MTSITRRQACALLGLVAASRGTAFAQGTAFPNRSVKIVVPFSAASTADVAIWMYCERRSVRRRSCRSASTPPASENRMIGSCCRNASSPRKNGECVSDSTSQFCATICIHVPMLDVQAPIHCTRKSR